MDRQIDIVIKAYSECEKTFNKVEGDIDRVTTASDKAGKVTEQSFNGMLKGVSQIRRGMFQLATVWGATFGLAIVSINKANEAMNKMRDSSVELGMSFEDLQRLRTGLVFDDKELKKAEQSINSLGNLWQGFVTSLGVGFAKLFPKMAEMNTMTEKQVDILGSLTDATNKLTMSSNDYAKNRIDKDYQKYSNALNLEQNLSAEQMKLREDALNKWRLASLEDISKKKTLVENKYLADLLNAEGNTTEALKAEWDERIIKAWEYSDEAGLLAERTADLQIKASERARWGIQATWEITEELQKQSVARVEDMFTDVFVDGLNNKFASARDILQAFFLDLERMAVKAMMSYAIQQIFGAVLSGFGGIPAGATEIGKAGQSGWAYSLPQRAGGGYIPGTGAYMLHRGESVNKASDTDNGGKVVQYYIQAVDARSFAQLVQSNPEAIETVVNNSMRFNKNTRSTIKSLAR